MLFIWFFKKISQVRFSLSELIQLLFTVSTGGCGRPQGRGLRKPPGPGVHQVPGRPGAGRDQGYEQLPRGSVADHPGQLPRGRGQARGRAVLELTAPAVQVKNTHTLSLSLSLSPLT